MATISEAMAIARTHQQAGRLQEAEAIYRRVVEAEPTNHEAWHLAGTTALQSNRPDAAAECFGRAIAICPDSPDYYNNLGAAYCALGRVPDGEACFRQALELKPDSPGPLRNLQIVRQRPAYPLSIPAVRLQPELDFLLLHLPPANYPMMPNGVGYIHNALLKAGVRLQTVDLNLLQYHRFTQRRVLGNTATLPGTSATFPKDPWGFYEHTNWEHEEVQNFFWPEMRALLEQIAKTPPKAVGLSIHASNRPTSNRFVRELRAAAPDVLVVVGGYDCLYGEVGPTVIPDFDYMAVYEGDLTIGPLATAIAKGERPHDVPGVISRFDAPGRAYEPGPVLEDLDSVDYPRYQWVSPELYRPMYPAMCVPISASRGCVWRRCRFCPDNFPYRCRAPQKVADEIEQWALQGACGFEFSEDDLNGDPDALHALCAEMIRRNLQVSLRGQLRVNKKAKGKFFEHLRRGGFTYLRFGVDAWCDNTLKLQRKGYTMAMVEQNLRDCHAAGIATAVNVVIGVPGETDADVDESIQNFLKCREYYDCVEFITPLYLRFGSEYFCNPDEYNIRFRGDRETVMRDYPWQVPDEMWYSENPYIDIDVRLQRTERIYRELSAKGIKFGHLAVLQLDKLRRGELMDAGGEFRTRQQQVRRESRDGAALLIPSESLRDQRREKVASQPPEA